MSTQEVPKVIAPPKPPVPLSEKRLMENWPDGGAVELTVFVFSWNEAPFVERCLKGILSQVTDFRFEVVVRDDFSTDGTRPILESYAKKYPQVIRLLLTDQNYWIRDTGWRSLQTESRAPLIAVTDADDFWCNTDKLALQRAALLSNASVSLVTCARADETPLGPYPVTAAGNASAWMFRKEIVTDDFVAEISHCPVGDVLLHGWTQRFGQHLVQNYVGVVRGLNSTSVTQSFKEADVDLWRLEAHIRLARLYIATDRIDLLFRQEAKIMLTCSQLFASKRKEIRRYSRQVKWATRYRWARARALNFLRLMKADAPPKQLLSRVERRT